MKLIIDIGNTVAKLVAFDGDEPVEEVRTSNESLAALGAFAAKYAFTHGIVGAVREITPQAEERLQALHIPLLRFTSSTPVPITNRYRTP